ncbi:MAG: tetratricopeptide repeat protein [Ferruginibacter sp.]
MKKQLLMAAGAIALVLALFIFGPTVSKKTKSPAGMPPKAMVSAFSIENFLAEAKKKLSPSQAISLSKLENNITRGDVPAQKIVSLTQIAAFWKDSVKAFEPYAWYISEAAKLENSEKNLTFAAQLFLDNLRNEPDEAKMSWESGQAVALFEAALQLNPTSDELKIGLGSSYIFGKGRNGSAEETMKGIQTLLSVVKNDSTNMKAQLVLGIGGLVSGQYDKAIARLKIVIQAQPNNVEAIAYLADAYAAKGDKDNAIKYYEMSKQMVNNPEYSKEVDERINRLN